VSIRQIYFGRSYWRPDKQKQKDIKNKKRYDKMSLNKKDTSQLKFRLHRDLPELYKLLENEKAFGELANVVVIEKLIKHLEKQRKQN